MSESRHEGVDRSHRSVRAVVLEVLGEQLPQAVVLGEHLLGLGPTESLVARAEQSQLRRFFEKP